jgi:3-oxoacyl-[acyl-carrier protein] reductase
MRKIIIVTGTSKGIGKSVAEFLLQKGCMVYGCGRSQVSSSNANYIYQQVDLSDKEAALRIYQGCMSSFGAVHGIVHNAGKNRDH